MYFPLKSCKDVKIRCQQHIDFTFQPGPSWGKSHVAVASMASSSGFAPPKLADFILTERLGSGTYATVYKAYRKVSQWRSKGNHHLSMS